MAFKRARPITESDELEIEMEWSRVIVDPDFYHLKCSHPEHEFYSEFYQWAGSSCEGRWFIPRLYGFRDNFSEQGSGVYFSNEADKIKFILKFM